MQSVIKLITISICAIIQRLRLHELSSYSAVTLDITVISNQNVLKNHVRVIFFCSNSDAMYGDEYNLSRIKWKSLYYLKA